MQRILRATIPSGARGVWVASGVACVTLALIGAGAASPIAAFASRAATPALRAVAAVAVRVRPAQRRANPARITTLTVDAHSVNPGPVIDKSRCLTLAAGQHGTYECGYLRLSYALPTTVTMGKSWTPTLVYRSKDMTSEPVVAANVSLQSSVTPDSVRLLLYLPGVNDTVSRTVTLPTDGRPRRLVISTGDINNGHGNTGVWS